MLGSHCHFFAGVYLMYTLRPLLSWQYFTHASNLYQLYMKTSHGLAADISELGQLPIQHQAPRDSKQRRMEESMYWSCFKSESEFRVCIPFARRVPGMSAQADSSRLNCLCPSRSCPAIIIRRCSRHPHLRLLSQRRLVSRVPCRRWIMRMRHRNHVTTRKASSRLPQTLRPHDSTKKRAGTTT